MKKTKSEKIRKLAITGVLSGIMLFLALTNIAVIPIGPANMSFCCVPIAIGVLLCGLDTGLILSAIFGLASMFRSFTAPSALVAPLLADNILYAIVLAIGPRLLIAVMIWLVAKLMSKYPKAAVPVASAAGSITNTVLYLGTMLFFYVLAGLDSAAVLGIIAGVGAFNGVLEAAAAVIVCTPVVVAVRSFREKRAKR